MARLYSNENFPQPVVEVLRKLGHDVETVFESGRAGQAFHDHEVLAYAVQQQRAVLTLNRRHFVRLYQSNATHSGILVCTVDLDFEGQATRIHEQIAGRDQLDGQLMRVNRPAK